MSEPAFLVRRGMRIQEIPPAGAIYLIRQRIISHSLFDSERSDCDTAAMIRALSIKLRKVGTFSKLSAANHQKM
jgi:hypothetical protein